MQTVILAVALSVSAAGCHRCHAGPRQGCYGGGYRQACYSGGCYGGGCYGGGFQRGFAGGWGQPGMFTAGTPWGGGFGRTVAGQFANYAPTTGYTTTTGTFNPAFGTTSPGT